MQIYEMGVLELLIRWARHDLHRGDLEFLSELTKGFASAERERVRRLSRRGSRYARPRRPACLSSPDFNIIIAATESGCFGRDNCNAMY